MAKVMLALSTFRRSEKAEEAALERAAGGELVIVFVADENLGRYLADTDLGLYPELKERYFEEVLQIHKAKGDEVAAALVARASEKGIPSRVHVFTGRFALKCLEVVASERPDVIVTTRSKRPAWVKKLFGAPVDYLIQHAGCPVIEA
jgi:nucleotide-binding universal stress UspA family protein